MSTTGLLTAYRGIHSITNGNVYWKPCCWLIKDQKIYLTRYYDFSGERLTSTRSIINKIKQQYSLITGLPSFSKILFGTTFFIAGLNCIFDEEFNLLLFYKNNTVWVKYGSMISSAKEKSVVKYLNEYLGLKTTYVESFDEIYFNPSIRFKTRQEILNIEDELTIICKKLLN